MKWGIDARAWLLLNIFIQITKIIPEILQSMKVCVMEETWQPPGWIYRKTCPPSDDAYFENMTHVISQAGLNWKMIEKKWQNFKKAFDNFSIDRVAGFNEDDIKHLMTDSSIVRN